MKKIIRIAAVLAALCYLAALTGCTRRQETDALEEFLISGEASAGSALTADAGQISDASGKDAGQISDTAGGDAGGTDGAGNGDAGGTTGAEAETFNAAGSAGAGQAASGMCYVYICGAVKEPGVYRMQAGDRVFEVIEQAGGFLETACEDYVNQAIEVVDGLKIRIPTMEEAAAAREEDNASAAGGASAQAVSAGTYAGLEYPEQSVSQAQVSAGQEESGSGLVNINTAGKELLCTLTGIGEAKAQAIIDYRSEHGSFAQKEDIMNVSGIKQSGYDKIKDQITVKQE